MKTFLYAVLLTHLVASAAEPGPAKSSDPGRGNPIAAAARPAQVGDFGDVRQVQFDGLETYRAASVRDALRANPEFLIASHPAADFDAYLAALRHAVIAGYQAGGFPNPRVEVRFEPGHGEVRVRVREGRRYTMGDVRIVGATTLSVSPLIRRLTEPYPPVEATVSKLGVEQSASASQSGVHRDFKLSTQPSWAARRLDRSGREIQVQPAAWERGKPASFNPFAVEALKTAATNALAELGCLFAQVEVAVVPEDHHDTATLIVRILDEGPRDVVEVVDMVGHERNSREALLELLGLELGVPIDQNLIADLELRLWKSGRFLSHAVTPERAGPGSTRIKLRVEVMENDRVPALTEKLSPESESLLRNREWLSGFKERDEDLVLQLSGVPWTRLHEVALEAVISPRRGLLLTLQRGAGQSRIDRHYAVLAVDQLAWYSPGRPNKLVLTNQGFQATVLVSYRAVPDRESPHNFEFGAGFNWNPDVAAGRTEPFRLETHFAPASFLSLAHKTNLAWRLEGGHLVARLAGAGQETESLRIDSTTGRLLLLDVTSPETGAAVRARFEPGLFDKRLQEVQDGTAAQTNIYSPGRPLSAMVELLAGEADQISWLQGGIDPTDPAMPLASWSRAAPVFELVFDRGTLAPLDQVFASASESGEAFHVPPEVADDSAGNIFLTLASGLVFRYCDDLFPKHSWPWTIARETVFVLKGKAQHTDAELRRLYDSDQVGPIGFLTIASLLAKANAPEARLFATRGLVRLSTENFRKDARLFVEADSAIAASIRNAGQALARLNAEQIDSLAAVMSPDAARFVRSAARLARGHPDAASGEPLSQALDEYWERSLKDSVRAALLNLVRGNP